MSGIAERVSQQGQARRARRGELPEIPRDLQVGEPPHSRRRFPMTKTFLLAVGLTLLASPALSQSSSRPDDRDAYSDRRDRDRGWARERDGWHDDERGPGRGARFMLRN